MKRIAAVVAAAGFGRRYGHERKLHALLDGRPVLAWTLGTLASLPLSACCVVIAPGDETAARLAGEAGVETVTNPDPAGGLGTSIACGVRALPVDIDSILIVLGDMPRVRAETCLALIERHAALSADAVVVPLHEGRRGHPVLFGAGVRPLLAACRSRIPARCSTSTRRRTLRAPARGADQGARRFFAPPLPAVVRAGLVAAGGRFFVACFTSTVVE